MNIQVMISLLKKGKNGEEILTILNSIVATKPTLDPIQF